MIKKSNRGLSPLFLIVTVIIILILMPSIFIVLRLFNAPNETWYHIKEYLLLEYTKNSIVLVLFTAIVTGIIGTFFGWMMARYKWKHSKYIELLLILPMAVPPYIAGYVYGGIFSPFGTLDRILIKFDLAPIRIDILSIEGVIFVFSLILMPYVFLITRSFFKGLPSNIEESSRLLGKTKFQTFFQVILPLSSASIMGGIVLVALEVLNDYGLVSYFGIPTFSTAIYKTWFGLADVDSAVRLAAHLMVIVILILMIEQFARGRKRVSQSRALASTGNLKVAGKGMRITFISLLVIYTLLSFFIPVIQLIQWSFIAKQTQVMRDLLPILTNTIVLAVMVTFIVILSGTLIANLKRLQSSWLSKLYSKVIVVGYSIPASIIAIAILVFFLSFDRSMSWLYEPLGYKKLFLTSSILMLGFALVIRFMTIGFNNIEAGMSKIGVKYYEASMMLGANNWRTFFVAELPLLKTAIFSGSILVFVDILKELPLTLILRPFNFDTLSTKVYTYAGDEMIHEASVYSLLIIVVSVVALMLMLRLRKDEKNANI